MFLIITDHSIDNQPACDSAVPNDECTPVEPEHGCAAVVTARGDHLLTFVPGVIVRVESHLPMKRAELKVGLMYNVRTL